MAKITAKGKLLGREITCTATDKQGGGYELQFDDGLPEPEKRQEAYEKRFAYAIKWQRPIANGWVPPGGSMIEAWNALRGGFFDAEPEIDIEGDIGTIPQEEDDTGIVY